MSVGSNGTRLQDTVPNLPDPHLTPRNQRAWRRWLEANHAAVREVWVIFYKTHARRPGRPTLTYGQAVEQAICFGWIDGLKRRIDDERYTHRFTPRKPGSRWSESNRERLARMRSSRASWRPPARRRSRPRSAPVRGSGPRVWRPSRPPRSCWPRLAPTPTPAPAGPTLTRAQQRRYEVWVGMAKREETRARRLAESLTLLRRSEKLGMR